MAKVVAIVTVALAGCYTPTYKDCAYTCTTADDCPSGFVCEGSLCRSPTGSCAPQPPIDAPEIFPDTIVSSGLVLWYSMETLANGTTDTSGQGHTARCLATTCPTVVQGVWGKGFQFDGVDDILTVDPSNDLNTPTAYTVSAWLRVDHTMNGIACLINKPLGASSNSWQLCVQGNTVLVHVTEGADLYEGPSLVYGRWYHAAIRWDGAEKTTWLDGMLVTTRARAEIAFDVETLRLGADFDFNATTAPFAGTLDDVRLYARTLSIDEIAALAAPPPMP